MKRVLIFVVAYNAEKTIASVLSRIPKEDLPCESEVLIIDDSSIDRTFETARASRDAVAGLKVTVLRNPANQGYGGNQKIGYEYAIANGYDAVALLHGDGQYAPEKLPELIRPVLDGEADACFGSRMMESGAALKNGMPFYKYVGNKVLTWFQNRALGLNLSEFHSGYRVYSVEALKRIPFRYNTDDFHFDTQIIIQLAMKNLRIKELSIPTYYGSEICHVNGLAYAWHVVMTTLASRMQRMGLLFRKKYDIRGDGPKYDAKLGYVSSHTMACAAVADNSSVLDLSCGYGSLAQELGKKGARVTGVDKDPCNVEAFHTFIRHDLNSPKLPAELDTYDYILALDCIEHLDSPESLLEKLRHQCYSEKTMLILTTPNIGFFVLRFALLVGQFNYGRWGVLDLTHKRLMTFGSFLRIIKEEGYAVTKVRGIPAPFPKAIGTNVFSSILLNLNRLLILLWPEMFAYQIYVEARFTPPLDRLLKRAVETSGK